jgi:SAM-dependent methyltransferase
MPSPLDTDYPSHDAEYRRRRQRGLPGWDDATSLQQTLTCFDDFLSDAHLPPAAAMLEFGCGAGDLMLYWARRGFRVAGIDISPFAIDWAREKAAAAGIHADFFVADLSQDLHLPLDPVDFILDGHCLHCVIGPDRPTFFRNALRCVKPGGLLHINSMCNDPHPVNLRTPSDFDPVHRCIMHNGIARRYFGRAPDILAEITAAGFCLEKHTVIPAQYEGDEDCLLANARAPAI